MKNVLQKMTAVAAAALMSTAFTAAQAATAQDVAKARAECAGQKQRVKNLEAKFAKGDSLAQAKMEWEAACQQAEILINELNGTKPPVVVPPTSS